MLARCLNSMKFYLAYKLLPNLPLHCHLFHLVPVTPDSHSLLCFQPFHVLVILFGMPFSSFPCQQGTAQNLPLPFKPTPASYIGVFTSADGLDEFQAFTKYGCVAVQLQLKIITSPPKVAIWPSYLRSSEPGLTNWGHHQIPSEPKATGQCT